MFSFLQTGTWARPTDKMAVYTEIAPGARWGIRVTLLGSSAKVEAIEGANCSWYKPPKEIATEILPPSFWERLRGISFEDKLKAAVEDKRAYAAKRNDQTS